VEKVWVLWVIFFYSLKNPIKKKKKTTKIKKFLNKKKKKKNPIRYK